MVVRPTRVLLVLASSFAIMTGCRSAAPPAESGAAPPEARPAAVATPLPDAAADAGEERPPVQVPEPAVEADAAGEGDASEGDLPPSASPDELQQEALELCQSAAEFLDRGETDDAVAALDRAYELMLALPVNGDTTYLQAKEDIRRLVADLLLRTYDSQRATAVEANISWDLAIEVVENDDVQREIRSFTGPERERFREAYRRSGRYRPMILARLEEAGLPSQISWLPLVESEFKVRALSRASALGLWQFIASTGLRFELSRDAWVDERLDPEKATDAAIAYLTELHSLFGDWPKALAAYNCGEARVLRLSKQDPGAYRDFWDLYQQLPRETRRYVPRFFAALKILEEPDRYNMDLPAPERPFGDVATIQTNRPVELDRLDALLGLDEGTLRGLNPELRHGATPDRPYTLKVPASGRDVLVARLDEVPDWNPPRPVYVTHRVRRGETLSGIAQRYGTSIRAIMQANRIRSANRIWPGQRLQIPTRHVGSSARGTYIAAEGSHIVHRGESLYTIARRYGTTVARLKSINNLSSSTIFPGQKLTVQPGSRGDLRRYRVQRGDTPGGIARRFRVALSALLRVNNLSSRSTIYAGQWLLIPE